MLKIYQDSDSKRVYILKNSEKLYGYTIGNLPAGFDKRISIYEKIAGRVFTSATRTRA